MLKIAFILFSFVSKISHIIINLMFSLFGVKSPRNLPLMSQFEIHSIFPLKIIRLEFNKVEGAKILSIDAIRFQFFTIVMSLLYIARLTRADQLFSVTTAVLATTCQRPAQYD
jgi:hypothetical protein